MLNVTAKERVTANKMNLKLLRYFSLLVEKGLRKFFAFPLVTQWMLQKNLCRLRKVLDLFFNLFTLLHPPTKALEIRRRKYSKYFCCGREKPDRKFCAKLSRCDASHSINNNYVLYIFHSWSAPFMQTVGEINGAWCEPETRLDWKFFVRKIFHTVKDS